MMKTICTILGTLMAASLFAQDNSNSLPSMPPPVSSPAAETAPAAPPAAAPSAGTPAATTAPAEPKHRKHHVVKKKTYKSAKASRSEPGVMLAPGPAEVSASELTVRGQAGLKGETITHLSKGETVTILEQINLSHHEADEPSQWVKIAYPTNADVWVSSKYISNGAVSIKKLNLRAGPGENYSVVGVVEQGTQVTAEGTKGDWTKIDPPAGAYAFVAAKYLTQEAQTQVASTSTSETPEAPSGMSPGMNGNPGQGMTPTPTQVQEQQPLVTTPPPAEPATPEQPAPPINTAPSVRIVQHEGVVGPVGSLIAPTAFKIYNPDTKVDIDYLYVVPGSNFDLLPLVDDRIIVTGEEGIDQRWPNTPVIAVQNIQVIATNVIKRLDLTQPRQRH
jgi:uncharacterized protein YgiM (DUF1202 family)